MIKVSRLNGQQFIVNADLIKFIEEAPDTILTLTTGEKLIIKESMDELIDRIMAYYRTLRVFPGS